MTLTQPSKHRARVPAEHRVLGLDIRSLPPALFVMAVFVVLTIVVPRIDSSLAWDDPTEAGEQLALTDTIEFTPTARTAVSMHRTGYLGSARATPR